MDTIEILKQAKKKKGITLKELSKKSGVSLGTVNKLFSGGIASVKVSTAQKLATALGVTLNDSEGCFAASGVANRYGYVKCAALTNEVKVADVAFNTATTVELIKKAHKKGVSIAVFPELNIPSYTASDLLMHDCIVNECLNSIKEIAELSKGLDMLIFVGIPFRYFSRMYNCAVAICNGEILAVIPKKNLPNYNEFVERRLFCEPDDKTVYIDLFGKKVPFGYKIILQNSLMPQMKVACEICEDLWVPNSPSISHALAGATIVANLSTSNETVGKEEYRRQMVAIHASKCLCAYIYSSSGKGESTSDVVCGGHDIVNESGRIIAESKPFGDGIAIGDIDCSFLEYERSKKFKYSREDTDYIYVDFALSNENFKLERKYTVSPFVPEDESRRAARCDGVLEIQAQGLRKRIEHTNVSKLVLGVSGGLDSTLAMLVCERALKLAGRKPHDLIAITMPCFGTSNRTYNNAIVLSRELKCTFLEIDIRESVVKHFEAIEHDSSVHNVVYENAQARERTQVLMDYANKVNGLVVGTGDMSESALGWATYNGDHMSMYSVNAGVPKTLVRAIVINEGIKRGGVLGETLLDIADTPISPELMPSKNGEQTQPTEDFVGPYILNDFYMYHLLKHGFTPSKVFYIAIHAFKELYRPQTIYKWLYSFIRRFFTQQFKRSCQPDSVKVAPLTLSSRGGVNIPSDASYTLWMKDLEQIKKEYNLD